MKTSLTILLPFFSFAIQAQQINTAEYFFDTDPGFGNATQITVNSASLDSTFNFTIPALTAGLHTLFVRLKNSANQWSTVYQDNVLIVNGIGVSAQIIKAEYFYDTDPGFGNGTSINLSNSILDSTLGFSVNGLTPGAHALFVRLQNSNNNWGATYQNNFVVWPGSSGIPQIQSLQYFIDTASNSVQLPLNLSATLDTTISVNIPDNGADARKLGLRVKNNTGEMGNATLADVSLCNLYSPVSAFRATRLANSYTFGDESKFNTSAKVKWYVSDTEDTVYRNSKLFSYTFPADFIGNKIVKQVSGTACRVDSSSFVISMPGIEKYAPQTGYIGHDFVVNIFGGGLDSTNQLYLKRGSTIIYPVEKLSYNYKILAAYFDFHNVTVTPGQAFDEYELHLSFLNGYDTVVKHGIYIADINLADCFRAGPRLITDHRPTCAQVLEGEGTFVTTDLSGAVNIRVGIWNQYTLNVTNVSDVLAKQTPVWLMIPSHYDVKFDLNLQIPHPFGDSISVDSLPPLFTTIDTIINGQAYQYKIYSFIPPFISSGETWPINFQVKTNRVSTDKIYYWVTHPLFGSSMPQKVFDCLWDAVGYLPYVGCFTSSVDYFKNKAGFPPGYRSDFSKGILIGAGKDAGVFVWNLGSVFVSCSGAKTIAKGAKLAEGAISKIAVWEGRVDKGANTINNNGLQKCGVLDFVKEKFAKIATVFNFDPNNITGNSDYDTAVHFINNYSPQHYKITFENLPTTTAKVQHVYITDTLNPAKFDFQTFQFTSFRIGDSAYLVPQYRTEMFETVKVKGNNSLSVKFVGHFDTTTGIIKFDFYSMDPAGIRPIADTSLNGFLPPNNTDGISGTGSVSFQVSAKNLNTLDTFSNKASIYFDLNTPIATNIWINTVDTTKPVSTITGAVRMNDTTFKLQIQHSDIGSGIQRNYLFVKESTDTVFRNMGVFFGDSVLFAGALNHTYSFYTSGIDNVGNKQQKNTADITIAFSIPLPLTWLSFTGRMMNEKVLLTWSTANEINTSRFDIEKSTDGTRFSKIGTVAAKRNTGQNNEYVSYDGHPVAGNNYYLLKQVDMDGRFSKSSIVRVYYGKEGYVMIAPNPAKDYVTISGSNRFLQIQLIDAAGKVIRIFETTSGSRYSLAGLSRGLYFLKLISGNDSQTFKLQIE